MVKPSCLQIMLPTHRQTDSRGPYSHPGPQWYSPLLSAHSGPGPLGGYCHLGHNGRQIGENPCGLHLPFPPTDRCGPVRLFRWGDADLDGRRPQRETCGLEIAAEHKRGKRLRDYVERNSCLIFGPDTPTTNSNNPLATPDVLDIVITKNLSSSVYLPSCFALILDHLPVLIDTTCRSSFHHTPDRPDFRRTNWAKFQTHLEDQIPFDPELHDGMAIDMCVENFSGLSCRLWRHFLQNVARVATHSLPYEQAFRTKYA